MSRHRTKIFLDPLRLGPIVERARSRGRTIVFANGCFELLHVGHVRYLAAAKALGDLLVVAVNTDASIARIKPGRCHVVPEWERFEVIAALEPVDFVIPLADRTPASLIELIRPHIQAKGTDYTLDRIPEREVVERHGGRVELVGGPKCRSTSEMIRSLAADGLARPRPEDSGVAARDPGTPRDSDHSPGGDADWARAWVGRELVGVE